MLQALENFKRNGLWEAKFWVTWPYQGLISVFKLCNPIPKKKKKSHDAEEEGNGGQESRDSVDVLYT